MPNPPKPVPAATVLLVRDGAPGLEVFMVVRHHRIDFAAGAMVFPGGKVHPADAAPEVLARCTGTDGLPAETVATRVAALREMFEECGVLLARPRGSQELVAAARLADLGPRYRQALESEKVEIGALLAQEDLVLACELLVPFAHWVTPELMPKRFDTHFFLAAAPLDQIAVHDGGESVDSVWTAPAAALAEAERGRRTIIFPTRLNLAKLARSRTVAEAIDVARRSTIVTVLPWVDSSSGAPVLRIPADAGYDSNDAPLEEIIGR
jgi:8-oxo-dGTP pyrophosphatase MutT (NUDIX family)